MELGRTLAWIATLITRGDSKPMTLRELAAQTGIRYGTLRQAAWDGRLGARKSGFVYLSTVGDVEHAVREGKMRRKG